MPKMEEARSIGHLIKGNNGRCELQNYDLISIKTTLFLADVGRGSFRDEIYQKGLFIAKFGGRTSAAILLGDSPR